MHRLPPQGEPGALPAVGRQQALPGERRLLRVPRGRPRRSRCPAALRPLDLDHRQPQGLRALPLPRGRGVPRVAPLQGRPHPRLPGQRPRRGRGGQQWSRDRRLPWRRLRRRGQRLLAVPRLRGEGPRRRQARPGHLAEHGHRADQPRRLRRLVQRLPQPPPLLGRTGAAPRHLWEVPHGSGSPAEGDLRGVQARDRVLRGHRRHEPRRQQVDRGRGLLRRAHLRDLSHVRDQGPARNPRHRYADLVEQPAGRLGPSRGLGREDEPAGQGRSVANEAQEHEERVPQLSQHSVGRQLLRPVRRPRRPLQREVRQARPCALRARQAAQEPGSLLEQGRFHLVRALAPRGPEGAPRGLDDGPGLHPLARHLRPRQELLHRVHPRAERARRGEQALRRRGEGRGGRGAGGQDRGGARHGRPQVDPRADGPPGGRPPGSRRQGVPLPLRQGTPAEKAGIPPTPWRPPRTARRPRKPLQETR